jgi:glycosyltransferase involved in cell wall biosynthesis
MSGIDVIIACYNWGRFLHGCVESVLARPGVDVRVLILDDASPDRTPEVAGRRTVEGARSVRAK